MDEQAFYSHGIAVETKAQSSDFHPGSLKELVTEYSFDKADWSWVFPRVGRS